MDPDLDLLLQLSDIVLNVFKRVRDLYEEEEWAKTIEGFHSKDYYDRQYQAIAAESLRDYNKLRRILIQLLTNQIKRFQDHPDTQT